MHSYLFLDWRCTVSSKFFDKPVFSVSTEELVLVTLAVSSLVFAAVETALCSALISPESAESRILHAAPAVIRPRIPLVSFCTVQLRTLCTPCFLATLFLYDFWSRPWGVAWLLGLHGFPPCPYSSRRVATTTTTRRSDVADMIF